MGIPDYQTIMLPLLKAMADGKEYQNRTLITQLSNEFQLSEDDRKSLIPSGQDYIFDNRVGWARTYLKKAGLVESTRRGFYQITDRGKKVVDKKPERIDVKLLLEFPEFEAWYNTPQMAEAPQTQPSVTPLSETPEELVESECQKLRKQLESEVLGRVKAASPEFFERLVVRLLTTMGYGGSLSDAGKAIGRSNDGGVDGVIKEDRLGLDLLYVQAKRWSDTAVGRNEIQQFVGALQGKKAKKGIFITTSSFTKSAQEYANGIETKVVLIDGVQLASMMFDFGVGVSTASTYLVKRIDSDFFDEESVPVVADSAGA